MRSIISGMDDLTSKDKRIKELERLTDKMSRELEDKEARISSIKQGLDRIVRHMEEDGVDRWEIFEALEEIKALTFRRTNLIIRLV